MGNFSSSASMILGRDLAPSCNQFLFAEFPIENKLSPKHLVAKSLSKFRMNNFLFVF